MKMTALEFAQAECANWRNDGKGSLGAGIGAGRQVGPCRPRPRCVFEIPGQRCRYFEECANP